MRRKNGKLQKIMWIKKRGRE